MKSRLILGFTINTVWGFIAAAMGFAIPSGDPKQVAVALIPMAMVAVVSVWE